MLKKPYLAFVYGVAKYPARVIIYAWSERHARRIAKNYYQPQSDSQLIVSRYVD